MTHLGMGAEARKVAGITDGLLQLSIGLEAEQDLIDDLERGLRAVASPVSKANDKPVATTTKAFWPAAHHP